ncbi:MAG TPA: acyl-protein synthetase [Deltaproteobacteria bacterium]|nr:acyl-protein synthetase [Deltaproteobacteria bacterium]
MRPWTGAAASLADRIAAFVRGSLGGAAPEPFEALALAIHRWQAAHDPVLASLIEAPVRRWDQIPAVPVALFKDLPIGTVGRDEPAVIFRTSGTTGGGRGSHRIRSSALYDLGATAWARRCVPGMPSRIVALLEDPATAPDASLSHMVARFGDVSWHAPGGQLDLEGLRSRLDGEGAPVLLASTAFALAQWLEAAPAALPRGSVVMVTGGFKGRVHRLEGDALYRATHDRLRPARLVTEYGMTELSSQLWGAPGLPYLPPPWLRVVAIDPRSGSPLPEGQEGQLRLYDLCNLDSTLGIETMDQGRIRSDGAVQLLGRLPGAPARGCSLTVEEAWVKAGPGGDPT